LQIILVYGRFPHSCLLYLASILVDEYGNLEFVQPGMLSMLEVFFDFKFFKLIV